MYSLSYKDCLQLDTPEKACHLYGSQPQEIFKQVMGRDPSQQELDDIIQHAKTLNNPDKSIIDSTPEEYKAYLQNTPESQQKTSMNNINAAQQMQVQANQPAIQTLQSQYNPDTGGGALVDRYKALLDSITASETPALNAQTLATNNELGRRGISSDSGVAQNQMAQSLLPITTQFGQLKANTGVAEQQDLGGLAANIAALRAGNVPNALNYGANLSGQQEALTAAQIAANAQQAAAKTYAGAQVQSAQAQPKYVNYPTTGLFNTQNGQNVLPTFK